MTGCAPIHVAVDGKFARDDVVVLVAVEMRQWSGGPPDPFYAAVDDLDPYVHADRISADYVIRRVNRLAATLEGCCVQVMN